MSRPTILVAEDNPITRKMVRFALESEGYAVVEAADGDTALRMARSSVPNLVIQDYVLPDMDGIQLLQRLRSLPGMEQVPVLMVTGMASQLGNLRAQSVGPTTVLPKPLEPSRMLEIVASYLVPRRGPTVGRGRRILVADDEALGRRLATLRLIDAGFEVETAADGAEALIKARARRPDAILSDVLMPGLDGFALCRAVRDDDVLGQVPVVLLSSAFVEEEDRRLAAAMGANALLARTPDFGQAIIALSNALTGMDAPSVAHGDPALDAKHAQRVQVQLGKQVARNEALMRQGAIQAAALSVVRGLAQTLSNPRDIAGTLGDVLVHCLDAAGLSTGLLFLPAEDGTLRLQAQAGLPSSSRLAAATAFGQAAFLRRVLDGGEPMACDFASEGEPALSALGAGIGRGSCLMVPFVLGAERLGLLVLGSDSHDLSESAWRGFAEALAAQFAQTIAVGRHMARGAVSEVRYQVLMENANDAILLLDARGVVTQANRQSHVLLGRPTEAILGREYREFVAAELLAVPGRVEGLHLARPDGTAIVVDLSVTEVAIGDEIVYLLILHDTTARYDAELDLRRVQRRQQRVLAASPAVLYTLRMRDGTTVPDWVSSNIERVTGHSPEQSCMPAWWAEHVHPEDLARARDRRSALLESGEASAEYRLRWADGTFHWIRDEQRLLLETDREPEIVGAWWDIDDLKEAERSLQASEEQYRLLFESNPQPMWVFDAETTAFLAVNEAAVSRYGYSRAEFLQMTIEDLRPVDELPKLRRVLRTDLDGAPTDTVWKHLTKAGTIRLAQIRSQPITFRGRLARLVLVQDVTEKTLLEAQLRQAQKMEAVGQLAGGVAHDFNNLLGVIIGYNELLRKDLGNGHPALARVEQVLRAADRAAALTRQLLAFSRTQVLAPKVLDLNAVVTGVTPMLQRLIREDVLVVTHLDSTLDRVVADPGQVEQVIMNLAVNARDAMPDGGVLILRTGNVHIDDDYAQANVDVTPGQYVMLAVSDDGDGMDSDTLAHIFEPFFTTKEPGKGTGLGLATVFGIVKQSGGHITVETVLGHGTTFRIYLPRVTAAVPPVASTESPCPTGTGDETILVVEDDESLRQMIQEILTDAGYTVLAARDPEEALAITATFEGPVHLVLTDVVMPGMDGRRMLDELRTSRPDLCTVFMSGYTGMGGLSATKAVPSGSHFLQKPFKADELLARLRQALA